MTVVWPVVAGLLLLGAAEVSAEREVWLQDIGVAERHGDVVCLFLTAEPQLHQTVHLVFPHGSQAVAHTTVLRLDDPQCGSPSTVDVFSDSHLLESPKELLAQDFPAIALLVESVWLDTIESRVVADIDGDGVKETFRSCASREGLHLTVWSGEPIVGVRRWHKYYYLGHDTEPTCTEADYGEDGA